MAATPAHDAIDGRNGGSDRKLVGLEMIDRGIARDGYPVKPPSTGRRSATSPPAPPPPSSRRTSPLPTSPSPSPTLGTELAVEIRGQLVKAQVVPLPFYKRTKKTTPTI